MSKSKSSQIIVRIQTPEGQIRLNLESSNTPSSTLYEQAKSISKNQKSFSLYTARPPTSKNVIKNSSRSKLNLKHGQMLFMFNDEGGNVAESNVQEDEFLSQNVNAANLVASSDSKNWAVNKFPEADIDKEIWDSKFIADHDAKPNFSASSSKMSTVNDLSINPWDSNYLESKDIKLMSFHSFMRMKKASIQNQKFTKLSHEVLSMERKKSNQYNISDLPSSFTLARQTYRHVDQVVFENQDIPNNFIEFWRKTNSQRIGFLYGNYLKTEDEEMGGSSKFPLGICAKVKAIYEPKQVNTTNKINFSDEAEIAIVDRMAKSVGLERVGWIVSDLLAEKSGTVKHLRHKNSYFLTAQEAITAASFQLQHPNVSRLSETHFGSKFVTVVCSGDENNQISLTAYQASNQCMDLVKSQIIVPTIDAPELAYVKESNDDIFVPDIYYKDIDEYKNEIKKIARPMPVEFLVTDMTVTAPKEQKYTYSNKDYNYPIENRAQTGQNQDFLTEFAKYLKKVAGDGISPGMLISKFVEIFRNFHLLVWLSTAEFLGCGEENVGKICSVLSIEDEFRRKSAAKNLIESDTWKTLLEICREQNSFGGGEFEDMDDDVRDAIKRSMLDR